VLVGSTAHLANLAFGRGRWFDAGEDPVEEPYSERMEHRTGMRGAWLVAAMATAALVAALPASGDGDFGPDTCLNGYVWREATSTPVDHVCVTPEVRTQTQQDNALASSRRNPNGGPFGPDTCLQGYVWREAVAGDHVCVVPTTRDQARTDNRHAAERRDEIHTTVSTYGSPKRYLVTTVRINTGQARVVLYRRATRRPIRSWTVSVPANVTGGGVGIVLPGGLLSLKTGIPPCHRGSATNAYFKVQDASSTRWSSQQPVCV
jgi:hypothetical protein